MFKHDLRNDGGRSVERFAQNARLVIIDVLICLRMRDPARDVVFDLVELLQRVDGLVGGFWGTRIVLLAGHAGIRTRAAAAP